MKTTGTKAEVLKYLNEFALPERPLFPKHGDRWQIKGVSFEKQLDSITSPTASVFFWECANIRLGELFPKFELAIKATAVCITE